MRDLFPGHYPPTAEVLGRLWETGTIIVDTNVLLDVYRVSNQTASELLNTLARLQPRLWLPYQAAKEYHDNLEQVIADQTRPYDDTLKQLREILGGFRNPRRHPFLEDALLTTFASMVDRVEQDLSDKKAQLFNMLGDNPTKERLAAIFSDRVGPAPDQETLEACYVEARERFEKAIPPGFADKKDKPEPARFGDFVLWKQVLSYLRDSKRPAILVTADVKEDWFQRVGGRTIGPRPELVAEASAFAGVAFYMYPTPVFLQRANEYLDAGVKQEAIEEVSELERTRIATERALHESFTRARRYLEEHFPETSVRSGHPVGSGDHWIMTLADGRRLLVGVADPSDIRLLRPSRRPSREEKPAPAKDDAEADPEQILMTLEKLKRTLEETRRRAAQPEQGEDELARPE